jgi:hypothetical protein
MSLSPLKSLVIGIFSGLVFFTLLSIINLAFWGALVGFVISGAVMTFLIGKYEKVSIYFKLLPGVVMSVFVLIYIIFIQQYYTILESIGFFLVFLIYLLTLSFLGGMLSALGSKLAQRLSES